MKYYCLAAVSELFNICPLMVILTEGFIALVITVKGLLKGPGMCVVVYCTLIEPLSPGRIGLSLGHIGTVQPQVDWQA